MDDFQKMMKKKNLSRQFIEENREQLLELYKKQPKKNQRPRLLTKKERKYLGLGKDQGLASVKNVRMAPVKANLLVRAIKGKDLDEAKAILAYSPKAAAVVISKVLNSAEANAVNNNELNRDALYVANAYVNPGPVIKRFMPRARGSATRILKRTCHITVVLKERQ